LSLQIVRLVALLSDSSTAVALPAKVTLVNHRCELLEVATAVLDMVEAGKVVAEDALVVRQVPTGTWVPPASGGSPLGKSPP
jgi:hypothetical protein